MFFNINSSRRGVGLSPSPAVAPHLELLIEVTPRRPRILRVFKTSPVTGRGVSIRYCLIVRESSPRQVPRFIWHSRVLTEGAYKGTGVLEAGTAAVELRGKCPRNGVQTRSDSRIVWFQVKKLSLIHI